MTDPIADMLTRIRNASSASHETVEMRHSRMKEAIGNILKQEGYLENCESSGEGHKKTLKLTLKYHGKNGVIRGLKRISKPGLRQYVGAQEIPPVLRGMGIAIVSTPQGLLTGKEARRRNVGGELVCFIW